MIFLIPNYLFFGIAGVKWKWCLMLLEENFEHFNMLETFMIFWDAGAHVDWWSKRTGDRVLLWLGRSNHEQYPVYHSTLNMIPQVMSSCESKQPCRIALTAIDPTRWRNKRNPGEPNKWLHRINTNNQTQNGNLKLFSIFLRKKSEPFYRCRSTSFYRETNGLLHSETTLVWTRSP